MNYKHFLPSYRSRFLFIQQCLAGIARRNELDLGFHLGCKEGEYDRMLASYVYELTAADSAEVLVGAARKHNKGIFNLKYDHIEHGATRYSNEVFDLVVVSDLLTVGADPGHVVGEIARLLVPNGWAILVFRCKDYPTTYDPINRIWQLVKPKKSKEYLLRGGAYAFGQETLLELKQLKAYCDQYELEIVEIKSLSGWLVGLTEMYWTGILRGIFKTNHWKPVNGSKSGASFAPPPMVWLTDAFLWWDDWWSGMLRQSVLKGIVLRKKRA